MLQRTHLCLKKGWTDHPGSAHRGAKNLAWNPKISKVTLNKFVPLHAEHPGKRPKNWQELEFYRLGLDKWPKEVGFYNAGDNFELTPKMMVKLFEANKDGPYWTQKHNEKVVVSLMPVVGGGGSSSDSVSKGMSIVDEVFHHHIMRFGADHMIYNVVMQACAFAGDLDRCKALKKEMVNIGLIPNAQTYVNLMLANMISGSLREEIEKVFMEAVKTGALVPIMRIDTEFQMWLDQLTRLGTFADAHKDKSSEEKKIPVNKQSEAACSSSVHHEIQGSGTFLGNLAKDTYAAQMPRDIFATWGWDVRTERKFVSKKQLIRDEARNRLAGSVGLYGTVYSKFQRQPWTANTQITRWDIAGPMLGEMMRRRMLNQPKAAGPTTHISNKEILSL
eukprot:Tbor_TRINITY_DN3866_c0_g1::TRINITY_DN3866_c0_g1_i1::g.5587::m.5587